jgi:CHAT domain-containing protein
LKASAVQKLLDFEAVIEPLGDGYRTRVIASPVGETHADFQLPFDDKDLQILILNIGQSIGALRRNMRSLESEQTQRLADFGGKLFNAVFGGPVREYLGRSLSVADSKNARLRIRLRLPGVLANVPWEYLHDDQYGFIGLAPEAALVRYVQAPTAVRPFQITPPLRILAMISAPTDTRALQADEEWDKLNDALSGLADRRMVEVDRLEDGTLAALQNRLRLREYHVLHFIGHGLYDDQAQDGALALEWPDRKKRLVTGRSLGILIRGYKSLRLVVLNACEGARGSPVDPYSGVAQALVIQGIPAVIAMQFEISDPAAVTFSKSFYKAIADGLPVEVAVAEARSTMFAEGNEVEWATPVLYLRSPNGRIFTKNKISPSDREAREREAKEAADREAREREAKEAADREAREREAKEAADREARVLRGAEDADVGGVRGADVGGVFRPRSRVAAGPWW